MRVDGLSRCGEEIEGVASLVELNEKTGTSARGARARSPVKSPEHCPDAVVVTCGSSGVDALFTNELIVSSSKSGGCLVGRGSSFGAVRDT